jgi:hypothetical protein
MAKTSSVNNQTTSRPKSWQTGMEGPDDTATEGKTSMQKKLPFPETYTVKQGTNNDDMKMSPPQRVVKKDFLGPDYTSENKNPNNETFAKTSQPKGANPKGLGEIGKLANSSTWGNTGNS